MIKGRRRLTSTILILLTLLLTTPTLFADGPGRKNVRSGRGRPAWFLKIPHFIFGNFRKFRNRYEFRKRSKHKKENSVNARRNNRRFGQGRRNRRFGRWH